MLAARTCPCWLMLLACSLALVLTRPAAAGFTWQRLTPAAGSPAPEPRAQAACGLIGSELIVFSGAGAATADVWAFDLTKRVWRSIATTQPVPDARHDTAHGVWEAQVCLVGWAK